MSDLARELVSLFTEAGALRFGLFTLKSGARSPFFFNLGDVSRGRHLARLASLLADGVRQHFPDATLLFGPAYKGIALVALAAAELHRRHGLDVGTCYNRKEAKGHGEGGSLVGSTPGPADRLLLIDDVITSGQTKREAIELLQREARVQASGVLVFVDRRLQGDDERSIAGVPLRALATLPQIADALESAGDARGRVLRAYHEGLPWE
jgi:orotate phosphoribosyltransferase